MKKKIIFEHSIASETFSYRPGQTAMVAAALADAWVASGVAQYAPDDPDELRRQIADLTAQLEKVDPKPSKK